MPETSHLYHGQWPDPDSRRAAIEYAIRTAFFEGFEAAHPPTGPDWDRDKFNEWCRLNFDDYRRTAAYESLINSAIARIR